MITGQHGISYEGAVPKPIRVNYGITLNDLLDKIYGVTGYEKELFKLKIICRYPACREYISVPIDDDESIDIMFDVARQPGTNCMELYIEREPVPNDVQVNIGAPVLNDNRVNITAPIHSDNQLNVAAPTHSDNQVNVTTQTHNGNEVHVSTTTQIDDNQVNFTTQIHTDNEVHVPNDVQVNVTAPVLNDNRVNITALIHGDDQLDVTAPTHSDNQVNVTSQIHTDNKVHVTTTTQIDDNQVPVQVCQQEAKVDYLLDPGPVDNSVLVLQNQHRSEAIWAGEDPGVLTCRQRLASMMREWPLDHRIRRFVIQCGFYGVHRIGFIQIDWPLITALVERWRQETHTFHFAVGESTVTLQDVAVLLGLQIQGHAITGKADLQWDDLCEELLGLRPDRTVIHGSALKLSWLRTHFQHPPSDADDVTLQRYARAYILGLIGSALFTDKSGADVQLIFLPLLRDFALVPQFSWGSAVLAHLYRELCRGCRNGASEIAGSLVLLQLWAWERLSIGRPEKLGGRAQDPGLPEDDDIADLDVGDAGVDDEQLQKEPLGCRWRAPVIRRDNPQRALIFYRDQLDQQTDDQMIWQPYTPERVASLPDVCLRDQHVWRTIAPLICYDAIEWHRPDRVLRQFGLRQGIPMDCDTEVKLHAIDRRGRHHYNWKLYHGRYIQLWEARDETIATGEPTEHPMHYHDPYMKWYRSITRRMITPLTQRPHMRFQPSSGTTHLLVQSLTTIYDQCTTTLSAFESDNAMQALTDIQTLCIRVLQIIGETRHLDARPAAIPRYSSTVVQSSPLHVNNMDVQLHLNHEGSAPQQTTPPATAKATSVRGRSRGRGSGNNRGRGGAASHVRTATSSCSSRSVAAAARTSPQRTDDMDRNILHCNQVEATSPAEPIHHFEGEKEFETVAPLPVGMTQMLDSNNEMERSILPPAEAVNLLHDEREAEPEESVHLFQTEKEVEAEPILYSCSKEELSQETQEESSHVTRPKKKKKAKHS
ncbi:serine/threonine-protein phosphatase 7 long form-like [Quillaja saponaria]|nr:serine/threonine-protein phosphatase 7 long form-like [Quillaja saponaria]